MKKCATVATGYFERMDLSVECRLTTTGLQGLIFSPFDFTPTGYSSYTYIVLLVVWLRKDNALRRTSFPPPPPHPIFTTGGDSSRKWSEGVVPSPGRCERWLGENIVYLTCIYHVPLFKPPCLNNFHPFHITLCCLDEGSMTTR